IPGIFPVLYEQLVNGIRDFRWVLCFSCRHLCSEAYNATCDDERKEFHPESPSRRVMAGRRYVRFNFAPRDVRSSSTLDTGTPSECHPLTVCFQEPKVNSRFVALQESGSLPSSETS